MNIEATEKATCGEIEAESGDHKATEAHVGQCKPGKAAVKMGVGIRVGTLSSQYPGMATIPIHMAEYWGWKLYESRLHVFRPLGIYCTTNSLRTLSRV
jgi:hypothetical protein